MPDVKRISAQVFSGKGVVRHSDATHYVAGEDAANYAYYRAAAELAIAFVGRRRELPEHGRDDAVPSSRGMKRHPALIPLSRDHHDGLVQALRLRRTAADGDASARLAAAREFVEFFRNEERVHLRDEEEELFPLFLRHVPSQPAPLREARVQHVQLEGFARKLDIAVAAGIVDRETLDAAGELLDAHIRLEERQLFPLIEELVPDDELRRLGLASRDVSCAVRRPAPHEEPIQGATG